MKSRAAILFVLFALRLPIAAQAGRQTLTPGPEPLAPGAGVEAIPAPFDPGPGPASPSWLGTVVGTRLFADSVSDAGDVDSDGYADILVGASLTNVTVGGEGQAFLFAGGPSGTSAVPTWSASGTQFNEFFGNSLAGAGDVNADGFDDVIVGALWHSNGQSDEGSAYVYLGSPSGLASTPVWSAESNEPNAAFGSSVASAGDVNGDGFVDVIVGALFSSVGGLIHQGRADVYLGSALGLESTPVWIAGSGQMESHYGGSVASAGDVNADGYDDVIVGADGYDNNLGQAFVYHGSASGPSPTPNWTAGPGPVIGGGFGTAVAGAGDVDRDGYADVLVGAPFVSDHQLNEGRAYAFFGSANGLATTAAWIVDSQREHALFGYSLKSAGDVDGDGDPDVIVGAYNLSERAGAAFVFAARPTGLTQRPVWAVLGRHTGTEFGRSVSGSGDVNGDGLDDVVIGAPMVNTGAGQGAAFGYEMGP